MAQPLRIRFTPSAPRTAMDRLERRVPRVDIGLEVQTPFGTRMAVMRTNHPLPASAPAYWPPLAWQQARLLDALIIDAVLPKSLDELFWPPGKKRMKFSRFQRAGKRLIHRLLALQSWLAADALYSAYQSRITPMMVEDMEMPEFVELINELRGGFYLLRGLQQHGVVLPTVAASGIRAPEDAAWEYRQRLYTEVVGTLQRLTTTYPDWEGTEGVLRIE